MKSFKAFCENILNFNDRTNRKSFWISSGIYFLFAIVLVTIFALLITFVESNENLTFLIEPMYCIPIFVSMAFRLGFIAMTVRRLHDVGKSAAFLFIYLLPGIGLLIILFFCIKDSNPQSKYIDRPYV